MPTIQLMTIGKYCHATFFISNREQKTALANQVRIPSCICNTLCQNFKTIYGDQEPSRNRVVVPTRKTTQAGGIDSLEWIPGLLTSLKNIVSVSVSHDTIYCIHCTHALINDICSTICKSVQIYFEKSQTYYSFVKKMCSVSKCSQKLLQFIKILCTFLSPSYFYSISILNHLR